MNENSINKMVRAKLLTLLGNIESVRN